jgi:hypothetical protein
MDDLLYDNSVCGRYSQRAERKLSLSLSLPLFGYEIPLYPFDAAVLAFRVTKRTQLIKRV